MERSGRHEQAATAYANALELDGTDVAAWIGLERVLTRLGRLETIAPILDVAITSHPANSFLRETQLRVWGALGQDDSLAAAAERWIVYAPGSPDPYRHWASATARRGQSARALEILLDGRAQIDGTALAPELAQAYVMVGDWADAAVEWAEAVTLTESHTASAVVSLRQTPQLSRDRVLMILIDPGREAVAHRLGAEVLVAWERPEEGWTLLDSALPEDPAQAAAILDRFVARTRRLDTEEAARAQGYALERLAEIAVGPDAERARLGAARAFADAGDLGAARRMLEMLAEDDATQGDAASAAATLIRVTLESGKVEEAETRFRVWQDRLRMDDAARLRATLAQAWIKQGELERASNLLVADSSIAGQALLGWVRLYQGDLASATEHFRVAGPYARSREEATRRTVMLALMQSIGRDSLPELGDALLQLEFGDTSSAIDGINEAVEVLDDPGERAHLLSLAGNLAVSSTEYVLAEGLLQQALAADSLGSAAPAAEFALAVVYASTGRPQQAIVHLEHLILTYSHSAVVPEARRLLDQVRGAIPKTGGTRPE